MVSKGIKNDQISSVKVADGYKVTLYNDERFAGSKKHYSQMHQALEILMIKLQRS